jgi:hypothetical protein
LNEDLIKIGQLNGLYNTTGIILNKLHERSKLLNLRLALYILMQRAVILKKCCTVRKFMAEEWIRSAWSVRPVWFWEPGELAWCYECGWWWLWWWWWYRGADKSLARPTSRCILFDG